MPLLPPDPLNDLSRYTRAAVFVECLSFGLLASSLWVLGLREQSYDRFRAATVVLALGALVTVIWVVCSAIATIRMSMRTKRDIADGTAELLAGDAVPMAAPGRVYRTTRARSHQTGILGMEPAPAAKFVVMTTLPPDGPPNRVGLLVPAVAASAMRRGTYHWIALHPRRNGVAALDTRIGGADPGANPRWHDTLPTNGSIVGGYWLVALWAIAGLSLGVGVGMAIGAVIA